MKNQKKRNIVCDTPKMGIRVVRFIRPDLRSHLDDQEVIGDCSLFRELAAAALANLEAGETLVVNLGLIDRFPTAFYRFLLRVREVVEARDARLLLCCFTPNVQECFHLMGGGRLFYVTTTEENAVHEAGMEYAEARREFELN